jgi:hypothetical protein
MCVYTQDHTTISMSFSRTTLALRTHMHPQALSILRTDGGSAARRDLNAWTLFPRYHILHSVT